MGQKNMISTKTNQAKLYQSPKKLKNHIITTLDHIGFSRFLERRKEPFTGEDFSLHLIDIIDALRDHNRELRKIESMPSDMNKKELDRFGDSLSDLVFGSLAELKFHILQIGPLLSLFEDFIRDEKMELPDLVRVSWFEEVESVYSKMSKKERKQSIASLKSIFSQFDFRERDVLTNKLVSLSHESRIASDMINEFVESLSLKDIEKTVSLTVQMQFSLFSILPIVLYCQELTNRLLWHVCEMSS